MSSTPRVAGSAPCERDTPPLWELLDLGWREGNRFRAPVFPASVGVLPELRGDEKRARWKPA